MDVKTCDMMLHKRYPTTTCAGTFVGTFVIVSGGKMGWGLTYFVTAQEEFL